MRKGTLSTISTSENTDGLGIDYDMMDNAQQHTIIEGRIEGYTGRGGKRYQMLDDVMNRRSMP